MTETRQPFHYAGRDLEAMGQAPNYHGWIRDIYRPFLHGDIAEVGAGDGSFSRLLAACAHSSLTLFEPSAAMFQRQGERLAESPGIKRHNSTFTESAAEYRQSFDSMVYVNVLEHIENDAEELDLIHGALRPGGHICLFVPALPWLMSRFDRSIGHYRRYLRADLKHKLEHAGFTIRLLHYFDLPGILPWLILMKWCRLQLNPGSVSLYDRIGIPLVRAVESRITPPIGKNLIAVAQKLA